MLSFYDKYRHHPKLAELKTQLKESYPQLQEQINPFNLASRENGKGTDYQMLYAIINWTMKGLTQDFLNRSQGLDDHKKIKELMAESDLYLDYIKKLFIHNLDTTI